MNYATGMATSPYSLKNMYIYGGSIMTLFTFFLGLLVRQDLAEALIYMVENYALMLLPLRWPVNEIIAADTVSEFIFSHLLTISLGLFVATIKYRMSVRY
ncbi:hypothetical protein [Natrarchaeobius halalkaliphilus]|nr:hypothetical protein [Natrarchaeobius halalkaliphilus]